ncbi:MAG: exodeoxyribonuclease V subunit alpha [Thalassotalea sp.]
MTDLAPEVTNINENLNVNIDENVINADNQTNIYANFSALQNSIAEIQPLDYFLAKEVCQAIYVHLQHGSNACELSYSAHEQAVVFHLVLVVSKALSDGHTCLPIHAIANSRLGYSCDENGTVLTQGFQFPNDQQLQTLLQSLAITPEDQQLLVIHQQTLYLRRYYQFEQELGGQLTARIQTITQFSVAAIAKMLSELFDDSDAEPVQPAALVAAQQQDKTPEIDWQKVAVANALNKNFTVIAGGPGTGKTYTVTKLLAALVGLQLKQIENGELNQLAKFALVAPTGKAAQRLSESIKAAVEQFSGVINATILANIPTKALTIHRLLGYIPYQHNFRHHQDNLLDVDFLLIDEASMVDLPLLTRVFRALPKHCKVVLLGDADQLPSVAVGSVLADIAPRPHPGVSKENRDYIKAVSGVSLPKISAKLKVKQQAADHLTFLLKSRRFDGEGGIGKIAKAVIAGDAETSWQLLLQNDPASGLKLLSNSLAKTSHMAANKANNQSLAALLRAYIEKYYLPIFHCTEVEQAFSLLNQFRILSATRVGPSGIDAINTLCRELFIHQGLITGQQHLYHAMPIIINENHHKLGVYNGDVGIVWRNQAGHLVAMFEQVATPENNFQAYKQVIPSRLPQFEPVYAMTIHKTQGSEFEHVLLVNPENSDNKLLSRELLYTGITRAKKALTVVSYQNVWRQGVENQVQRFSNLQLSANV